ncbi:MAG: hypothetical protein M1837_003329 [Sclerophora amabilis]|nr:MAG: hypothetical protein M1837_003329 [Sclerophora amabilis]
MSRPVIHRSAQSILSPRTIRSQNLARASSSKAHNHDNIESALATPSWSVRSLLPPSAEATDAPTITPKQLHHLLRLSALPAPSSSEDEAKMLQTLRSQLHFVKDVQSVDTKDVEPLRSIRDETPAAQEENRIGLKDLQVAFDKEETLGITNRIRRKKGIPVDTRGAENWDVLGQASRKVGKYFVVETSKE